MSSACRHQRPGEMSATVIDGRTDGKEATAGILTFTDDTVTHVNDASTSIINATCKGCHGNAMKMTDQEIYYSL